ncbi:hypothetical protein [Methyloceanibacter caenitepidi]|uniref:Uncharacterized protein n=1 Tax=Methyloceanibacter caenitepidi TaxID=1384459 RepID=A0A0A8K1W3_9HYPH|nr:hypothetical protein [Methyloceanibacter caenitepidi]BAQ16943.1 hypothetical protein GL4_1487 [Methyloceanibacter caenitepidi]
MTKDEVLELLQKRYQAKPVGQMSRTMFCEHLVECVFETAADILSDSATPEDEDPEIVVTLCGKAPTTDEGKAALNALIDAAKRRFLDGDNNSDSP